MLFSNDGNDGLVLAYIDPESMSTSALRKRQAAGQCGPYMFHTADAGAHWQRMTLPATTLAAINRGGSFARASIDFLNSHEGWALDIELPGDTNTANLYHTTDSGASWTLVSRFDPMVQFDPAQTLGFYGGQLVFRDAATALFLPEYGCVGCVVPTIVFVSHDGGVTWHKRTLPSPPGVDLSIWNWNFLPARYSDFANGLVALQVNGPLDEYFFSSTDGGDHWSYSAAVQDFMGGQVVSFIDRSHWIAWARIGGLLRTEDGGKHWHAISASFPGPDAPFVYTDLNPDAVDFRDLNNGWTVVCPSGANFGPNCLSTTKDGGAHWTNLPAP
jgi:photosystem II stability/assembly factor-like uncharacterized protein